MTKPLTTGEKNRRANIRAMKAIGVRNAQERAQAHAARNQATADLALVLRQMRIEAHEQRNVQNRVAAIAAREDRIAAHEGRNKAAQDAAQAMPLFDNVVAMPTEMMEMDLPKAA